MRSLRSPQRPPLLKTISATTATTIASYHLISPLIIASHHITSRITSYQTLLIAGHETTAAVLTWTMHLLADRPDVVARIRAEVCDGGRGSEGRGPGE